MLFFVRGFPGRAHARDNQSASQPSNAKAGKIDDVEELRR